MMSKSRSYLDRRCFYCKRTCWALTDTETVAWKLWNGLLKWKLCLGQSQKREILMTTSPKRIQHLSPLLWEEPLVALRHFASLLLLSGSSSFAKHDFPIKSRRQGRNMRAMIRRQHHRCPPRLARRYIVRPLRAPSFRVTGLHWGL